MNTVILLHIILLYYYIYIGRANAREHQHRLHETMMWHQKYQAVLVYIYYYDVEKKEHRGRGVLRPTTTVYAEWWISTIRNYNVKGARCREGRRVAKPPPNTYTVRRTDSVGLTGPWPPSPASRSSQGTPA